MHFFPNGHNLQFMPPAPLPEDPPKREAPTTLPYANVKENMLPKSVAQHMNRKERRIAMVKMRQQAMQQTKALARKEMTRQKKGKSGE